MLGLDLAAHTDADSRRNSGDFFFSRGSEEKKTLLHQEILFHQKAASVTGFWWEIKGIVFQKVSNNHFCPHHQITGSKN